MRLRGVRDGIVQQVDQHLNQQVVVPDQRRRRCGLVQCDAGFARDCRIPLENHRDGVGKIDGGVLDGEAAGVGPRQRQQGSDQPGKAAEIGIDPLKCVAIVGGGAGPSQR